LRNGSLQASHEQRNNVRRNVEEPFLEEETRPSFLSQQLLQPRDVPRAMRYKVTSDLLATCPLHIHIKPSSNT